MDQKEPWLNDRFTLSFRSTFTVFIANLADTACIYIERT